MGALDLISTASLLSGLDDQQVGSMARIVRQFKFKKGEYLFRLGDEADTLFVIGDGSVELTLPLVVLGGDKELVVEELSSGATLAWSTLIAPHLLTMSARATTEVELVGFGRGDLTALFDSDSGVGYRVLTNLAAVIGRRLHTAQAMWARELQRSVSEKYR